VTALPVVRLVGGLLAGLCLVTLVGCASVKLDATSASPLVLERLRGSNLQPI